MEMRGEAEAAEPGVSVPGTGTGGDAEVMRVSPEIAEAPRAVYEVWPDRRVWRLVDGCPGGRGRWEKVGRYEFFQSSAAWIFVNVPWRSEGEAKIKFCAHRSHTPGGSVPVRDLVRERWSWLHWRLLRLQRDRLRRASQESPTPAFPAAAAAAAPGPGQARASKRLKMERGPSNKSAHVSRAWKALGP